MYETYNFFLQTDKRLQQKPKTLAAVDFVATGMNQKDASVQKPQVKENENTTGTKQKQNIVVVLEV